MNLGRNEGLILLLSICILSTGIKIWITPWGRPLFDDALLYHDYARMLGLGEPYRHIIKLHNVGFSYFLAPFFYITPPYETLMFNVQRIITMVLSSVFIIGVYHTARHFVRIELALLAAVLVGLDPRVMENSTLGLTEPLFLSLSIFAVYYGYKRTTWLAFLLAGLASIVRFEAIMLFPIICIISWQNNTRKKDFLVGLALFILPMVSLIPLNIENGHDDGFISKIQHEAAFVASPSGYVTPTPAFWLGSLANSLLHLGWSLVPMFCILAIPALITALKTRNYTVILFTILLALPGVYAYLDAYDMRYFFPFYGFMAILSVQSVIPLYHFMKPYLTFKNMISINIILLIIAGVILLLNDLLSLDIARDTVQSVFALTVGMVGIPIMIRIISFMEQDDFLEKLESLINRLERNHASELLKVEKLNALE